MATKIFPSHNDVGGDTGDGRIITEPNLAGVLDMMCDLNDWIKTGLEPTAGSGLQVNVSAGEAFIQGYHVTTDASMSITMTDDATRGLFLQLTRDGSDRVTGVQLLDSSFLIPGVADTVMLGYVRTAGGALLEVRDERRWQQGVFAGAYVGDGTLSRFFDMNRTPVAVAVMGAETNNKVWAFSGFTPVGYREYSPPTALPGFRIVEASDTSYLRPVILTGSKTWDPGSTGPGNVQTTTLTVTGARMGDVVSARHSSFPVVNDSNEHITAEVAADDTVKVTWTYDSGGTGNRDPASSTLSVVVYTTSTTQTVEAKECFFANDIDGSTIPVVVAEGFRVSTNGAEIGLNDNGREYRYLAWM